VIRLYDTLAREKRDFVPADPKRITMYVCGPTVYGRAHIGNARPAVVFDLLRRLLEHEYPDAEVIYARNVTDVDDKIIAAAAEEGVDPAVITERYEAHYLDDMRALGVRDPTIAPHATAEIPAMVAMIERLIATGNAYEAQGHVLFSVPSDPDYGALSRRDRDSMIAGARVEVAPYKRDPADFVLWKPSEPDVVGWDSPWGRGRPGWHIECSAMIRAHLGETIDIHGGGLDLIFPHHENEIAQSRCAHHGAPLARYWVHNGFVDMGSDKMSKSLGNIVTPGELLKTNRGETLRLALLSAHYRQPLPWTETLVAQAKATLDRWYRGYQRFVVDYDIREFTPHRAVLDALGDDLNTPAAIATLGSGLKAISVEVGQVFDIEKEAGFWIAAAHFMGFLQSTPEEWFQGITAHADSTLEPIKLSATGKLGLGRDEIDARIAERSAAKAARDFATADRIREELMAEGILLEDGPEGTTWRRA
jgi:cysteinyl-tRNA synthetase